MGTGKTEVTLAIAAKLKWKIFVVALKSGLKIWSDHAEQYGIEILDLTTYEGLNLVKGRRCQHGYLVKNGDKIETTEKFDNLVKGGLLLIFDEVQKVKNNTSTLYSCHALVKSVVKHSNEGARSRVALLSATPIDNNIQIVSILKMLGIVTADDMYTYNRKKKQYLSVGFEQVQQYCERFDLYKTQHICSQNLDRKSIYAMCWDLYLQILKDQISSEMPPIKWLTNIKNGYYDFEPDDLKLMQEGMELLKTGVEYDAATGNIKYHQGWEKIPIVLRKIENAKVRPAVRLAIEVLERNSTNKVILFFRHRENIQRATELLKAYGALCIYGPNNVHERTDAQNKFQQPNAKYRAIVANTQVAGISIQLDDQVGGFTRHTFIVPNHRVNEQFQAIYRGGGRAKSESDNIVRFVYSKLYPEETSIINAMTTKGKIFRQMSNDLDRKVKYPNEYEVEIEGATPENIHQFLELWSTHPSNIR